MESGEATRVSSGERGGARVNAMMEGKEDFLQIEKEWGGESYGPVNTRDVTQDEKVIGAEARATAGCYGDCESAYEEGGEEGGGEEDEEEEKEEEGRFEEIEGQIDSRLTREGGGGGRMKGRRGDGGGLALGSDVERESVRARQKETMNRVGSCELLPFRHSWYLSFFVLFSCLF